MTLLGIAAYILIQLLIGVIVSRRIATETDYLLAGRSVGTLFGTFTVFATWFGAESCIGAAGAIYKEGLSGGAADPFGYSLCLILMGAFFARALWIRRITTLGDLYRTRYSPSVERLAILLMAPTSIMWAGAQIRAFGQVLAASSNYDIYLAITVAAGVVIVYTVFGGLLADIVTDFVQGSMLIVGLIVLGFAVVDAQGGMDSTLHLVRPEQLRLTPQELDSPWRSLESWAIPICGSLFAQELVARVLASRSAPVARSACLLGGTLYLAIGCIPLLLGLLGPHLVAGLDEPEQLVPQLARSVLSNWGYLLFAGALISAILSTVDSALMAASALISHNLIVPAFPHISERGKVRVARLCVVLFGLVAYGLALTASGIHDLVEDASAFGSSGLFVITVFGLAGSFGGPRSAFAALCSGMAVWLAGRYAWPIDAPYVASLGSALLAFVLVAAFDASRSNRPTVRPAGKSRHHAFH